MSKKKQPLIETHGKDETQPTSLDQIFGFNDLSKYGTLDENEYRTKVLDMNRPELESHARSIGVVIVESSNRLQEKLLTEFRSYISLLRKPITHKTSQVAISDEVRKILSEGR